MISLKLQTSPVLRHNSRDTCGIQLGLFIERDPDIFSKLLDLRHISLMGKSLQPCNSKKVQHSFCRLTKTVDQLLQHIVIFLLAFNTGNTLINIQLLELVADIGIRDKRIDVEINGRLKIIHSPDSLCFLDSLTEHLTVKVITNCVHMPVLLSTEKISCSTKLQILHSYLKTASKV